MYKALMWSKRRPDLISLDDFAPLKRRNLQVSPMLHSFVSPLPTLFPFSLLPAGPRSHHSLFPYLFPSHQPTSLLSAPLIFSRICYYLLWVSPIFLHRGDPEQPIASSFPLPFCLHINKPARWARLENCDRLMVTWQASVTQQGFRPEFACSSHYRRLKFIN